ncbi:MAG: hypothetical protein ACRDF4_04425, partial [Rhabdochlamydiaceae bacterium]
ASSKRSALIIFCSFNCFRPVATAMSKKDFVDELKALGYQPDDKTNPQFVIFDYDIQNGSKIGQRIKLAFGVQDDFPLNPPGGPHVSPRLFPFSPGGSLPHPRGAVNPSPLGGDWEYWSRPYPNWNATDRTVRTYMRYIRRLFEDV